MNTPHEHSDKEALGLALRQHLDAVRSLRLARASGATRDAHLRLKEWQSKRLATTYADLLADKRHRPAAEFFLNELYGVKDFTGRDSEVARMVPMLLSALPVRALVTLVEAIRMDALSESLDTDMVACLQKAGRSKPIDAIDPIDHVSYAAAYRACGRVEDRKLQIALVGEIGHTLDRLTRMPMIGVSLSMMKKPAELAGLSNLQSFLHHGYQAFRTMKGADYFLQTIQERETLMMETILGTQKQGHSRNFQT